MDNEYKTIVTESGNKFFTESTSLADSEMIDVLSGKVDNLDNYAVLLNEPDDLQTLSNADLSNVVRIVDTVGLEGFAEFQQFIELKWPHIELSSGHVLIEK